MGETSNKNGYRININQKPYSELYERYKKYKDIPKHIPLSDDERTEFERYALGEMKGVKNE